MFIRLACALGALLLSACLAGPPPSAGDPARRSVPPDANATASPAPVGPTSRPGEPRVARAFTSAVQYLPGAPTVTAADLVDPDHGWVGGTDGIYATRDGGSTWIRQYDGPIAVRSLDFVDLRNGFALGADRLLATTDGGAHWEPHSLPSLGLRSIKFQSPSVGWGIGAPEPGPGGPTDIPFERGRLLGTVDGGRTWRTSDAPASAQTVCFGGPVRGWVGDANRVWSTSDGGSTWRLALSAFLVSSDRVGWRAQVRCAGDAVWVQFAQGGAGGTGFQVIYRSADGGTSWLLVTARGPLSPFDDAHSGASLAAPASAIPGTYASLEGVLGPLAAYFSGGNNAGRSVAITNDGGSTVVEGLRRGALSVDFADVLHGWAVVFAYRGEASGNALLTTSDGGRHWQRRFPDQSARPTLAIDFVNESDGWGLGTDDDARTVLRTHDGGGTWEAAGHLAGGDREASFADTRSSSLSFSDAQHGWAVVAGGALQATDDGGTTWRVVAVPGIAADRAGGGRAVALLTPAEGAVLAGDRLFFTVDGGTDWTPTSPLGGRPLFLSCAAAASCWTTTVRFAAAPVPSLTRVIEIRRDGGVTVVPLVPDLANSGAVIALSMRAPGGGAVAAIRECGEIAPTCVQVLATSDGGATWVEDRTGIAGRDGDLEFLDADRGWLLTSGRLFRTTDGGLAWKQVS